MKKRMINYLLVLVMLFTMTETVLPLEADAAVSKYTWKESVAPNYVKKIGKAKVYKKPKRELLNIPVWTNLAGPGVQSGTSLIRWSKNPPDGQRMRS